MVTDQPEIIQVEEPISAGTEYFTSHVQLSQQLRNKCQAIMETYIWKRSVHSLLTELTVRRRNQEINTASGAVLIRTPHKEALSRPSIAGFLELNREGVAVCKGKGCGSKEAKAIRR
jgi:hypothetical protein